MANGSRKERFRANAIEKFVNGTKNVVLFFVQKDETPTPVELTIKQGYCHSNCCQNYRVNRYLFPPVNYCLLVRGLSDFTHYEYLLIRLMNMRHQRCWKFKVLNFNVNIYIIIVRRFSERVIMVIMICRLVILICRLVILICRFKKNMSFKKKVILKRPNEFLWLKKYLKVE